MTIYRYRSSPLLSSSRNLSVPTSRDISPNFGENNKEKTLVSLDGTKPREVDFGTTDPDLSGLDNKFGGNMKLRTYILWVLLTLAVAAVVIVGYGAPKLERQQAIQRQAK